MDTKNAELTWEVGYNNVGNRLWGGDAKGGERRWGGLDLPVSKQSECGGGGGIILEVTVIYSSKRNTRKKKGGRFGSAVHFGRVGRKRVDFNYCPWNGEKAGDRGKTGNLQLAGPSNDPCWG